MHDDPTDGRAKLARFTDRGRDLVAVLAKESAKAEKGLAHIVGTDQMEVVRQALVALIHQKPERQRSAA